MSIHASQFNLTYINFVYPHLTFFSLLLQREDVVGERGREGDKRERDKQRSRERERERENINMRENRETSVGCPLVHAWTRDQSHNLGMCPDRSSNSQPFGPQDDAPTK